LRFDVSGVGLNPIKAMLEIWARVLYVGSKKSIILKRDKIIKESKKAGISIVGYSG
jgi:DUF1009 family protein